MCFVEYRNSRRCLENPDYLVKQDDEEYGFLNLKLEDNGKTLVGEFRTGEDDDDMSDTFKLIKL
jgi:hypothetical protein